MQNTFRNMKISADTEKIISGELMKYKDVKWTDMGISKPICDVLEEQGFAFPSPVQYKSIPKVLDGKDVLVRSKNGSGKTLSFIIPILEKIETSKNTLQAIIIVPIRELALQIARISRVFCKEINIKSTPLVGGADLADDIIRVSNGVHLLIGTPGRIMSQDERNKVFHNFSKNKCKILVSTDVTTRGTDVKGVNIVINFDLPSSSESFLHRQGRS
ncbi:uncharacterized protein LOC143922145, partial [Arctopsyche grandis]|uniref:uncharacterized protein LOC143922145 n=1 Tax=Arctopsyche grandis TaxID=121162 RepID=UPI00406D63D5